MGPGQQPLNFLALPLNTKLSCWNCNLVNADQSLAMSLKCPLRKLVSNLHVLLNASLVSALCHAHTQVDHDAPLTLEVKYQIKSATS